MIQILRLIKGYVEFCAEGGFPERFVNAGIAEANMIELFLGESFGKLTDKQKLALKNMQFYTKLFRF